MRRRIAIALALIYPILLLLTAIGNAVTAPGDTFPDSCPEESMNCERATFEVGGACPNFAVVLEEAAEEVDESLSEAADGHWVFTTQWMRFKDDVFIQHSMQGDTCTIQVHSESRLGMDDLGANEERMAAIRAAL